MFPGLSDIEKHTLFALEELSFIGINDHFTQLENVSLFF